LNYLTERINAKLDDKFQNTGFMIEILFINNTIRFTTNIPGNVNGNIYDPKIQFRNGCDNLFHISLHRDALGNPMKYGISINHKLKIINVPDISSLYFHASFSDNSYGYVCRINESYHKLVKKYPLLYGNFEVWFTIDGKNLFRPQIQMILLELSFLD
jgi:hypothetical protein